MKIATIKNKKDHAAALKAVDAVWESKPGSKDAEELDRLVTLIEKYEDRVYPLPDLRNPKAQR